MPLIDEPNDMFGLRPFYAKDGQKAPIRCIVKDLGSHQRLTRALVKQVFEDIKGLHQLGIIGLDVKFGQLIDRKLADFSIAQTLPHIATSPELNPGLPSEWSQVTERETWDMCRYDFLSLSETVGEWNGEAEKSEDKVIYRERENRRERYSKYRLRGDCSKKGTAFVYVDPRERIWERKKVLVGGVYKVPLKKTTVRWYKAVGQTGLELFNDIFTMKGGSSELPLWEYRDGLIFPGAFTYTYGEVDGKMQRVRRQPRPEETEEEKAIKRRANERDPCWRQVPEDEYVECGPGSWLYDFVNRRRRE